MGTRWRIYMPLGWTKSRQAQARVGVMHFRTDPIPWTGYGNKGSRNFYRRMRTQQERRASCDVEYGGYARSSRNLANLVNAWDDIPKGEYRRHPSWKHRKKRKQWM